MSPTTCGAGTPIGSGVPAAFGAQNPLVRRIWPRRCAAQRRLPPADAAGKPVRVATKLDRAPARQARAERVVQDVEIPLENTAEFLHWFARQRRHVAGLAVPAAARGEPVGRSTPRAAARSTSTSVSGARVPIVRRARDGDVNRAVERAVAEFGGHKSLYSDVYYDRQTFDDLYGGEVYWGPSSRNTIRTSGSAACTKRWRESMTDR